MKNSAAGDAEKSSRTQRKTGEANGEEEGLRLEKGEESCERVEGGGWVRGEKRVKKMFSQQKNKKR